MNSCGKRAYLTENLALQALHEAKIRFGNSAKTVYKCELCQNWHLTSAGVLHPNLKKSLENGTLEREKEAYFWETKLRK